MLYSLPTVSNTTSHSHCLPWYQQTCRNNGFRITRAAPTAFHVAEYPRRASHARRARAWLPVLPAELSTWEVMAKPFWGAVLLCDSLCSLQTQGASKELRVYRSPTCCPSRSGLPLQCGFRGCSHLSRAVLLNCFLQHQVRGCKPWSSCWLIAWKATDGLRQSHLLHRKVCGQPLDNRLPKVLGCPHSECSVIFLDLSANSSLTVKSWCLLELYYSKCALQTSHEGITWELVRPENLRPSPARLNPQFTPSSGDAYAQEGVRSAELENPHLKRNVFASIKSC